MHELDKALAISLTGPAAEAALAAFRRQAETWQLALPPVEPLVLDFGLGDFQHTGLIEYWIANEAEAGYCAKYLFVFDGQTCPAHRHGKKHETFFLVRGEVIMCYDGVERHMRPGDVQSVEPWKYHRFTGLGGPALLLEVSMPCSVDDNLFENPAIPIGGNWQGRWSQCQEG
jgi:D-lyxose ketol-isomerase